MEGEISPLPFFSSLTGVIIKLTQDRLKEGGLVTKSCLTLATPWTVACQAPLWDSPGKNTGVGCHFLF